jgi:hypothetical protein
LSHLYREYGVDALEGALRVLGDETLVKWMVDELEMPLDKRIRLSAIMTHAHSSLFTITEDEEKFTIVQNVCGTCARQVRDGRYGPPLDLAIVTEEHPVTWGRGNVPIYRTHVPVMHWLMPRERFGFPLPVVECPYGVDTGPCPSQIYKDARQGASHSRF